MLLCFSIRTRTRQWGWRVELWTDSSAMTSWLNLSAAQCTSSAVQLLPSLCPRASSQAVATSPHVPGWVGALQPDASPVCYPRSQRPHCSSSFLPSPHGCCAGSLALSFSLWGGKIALPYRSRAGNSQNTPRRGECRLRKCQVPLSCSFQIYFCTVPTHPSPH